MFQIFDNSMLTKDNIHLPSKIFTDQQMYAQVDMGAVAE